MKYILGFLVLLSVSSWALAQGACNFTSCATCTALDGCGWCAATQTCSVGTAKGPTQGKCLQAWEYGANGCAQCSTFNDCRQCQYYSADCFWCKNNNKCTPLDAPGGCIIAHTCPCEVYADCGSCIVDGSCDWCQDSLTCQAPGGVCTTGNHNMTSGCPCEANTHCDSCREDIGCAWCVNSDTCSKIGTPACVLAHNQSCEVFCNSQGAGSCDKCNNIPGCGWCPQDSTCRDGRSATCLLQHNCQTCSRHNYCDPCLDDTDCKWCEDTATCQEKSAAGCFAAHTCDSYCMGYAACEGCNSKKGCGWCSDTNTCHDVGSSDCAFWSHGCTPTVIPIPGKCGFDGAAFVGGMFLIIGCIFIGVLAFIFYRWKIGKHISYTELR